MKGKAAAVLAAVALCMDPAKPVAEQFAALERGDDLPSEAEAVTETILLGCRAMMTGRRVTAEDCKRRYMREEWEW